MTRGAVAIVGAGWEAWLAAALLAVLLRGARDIVVVGDSDPEVMPIVATTSEAVTAHRLLRLDDTALRTVAVPRLGTAFNVDGQRFFLPSGPYGDPVHADMFPQQWLRLRSIGRAEPLSAYSPGERLALAADRSAATTSEIARALEPGLFLEPAEYARLLRRAAESRGVRAIDAMPVAVERSGQGRVDALRLNDGTRLAADLLLEASGGRRLLTGSLLGFAWIPRGSPLSLAARPAGAQPPTGYGIVKGESGCLCWEMPHPDGGGVAGVVDRSGTGGWRPGAQTEAWTGNVVALGSAQRLGHPLEPFSFESVQRAVARLVTLFPEAATLEPLAREYNRQLAVETDAFALAGDALFAWSAGGEELDRRRAAFRHAGRVPEADSGPLSAHQWLGILIGNGEVACRYDPNANRVPVELAADVLARWETRIRTLNGLIA
jgi:tryptophan halogenase